MKNKITENAKIKQLYGWSQELENNLKKKYQVFLNPKTKGVFKIKKINRKLFWYYILSKRYKRTVYLCSTNPKKLDKKSKSFEFAFNKLKIKFEESLNSPLYMTKNKLINHKLLKSFLRIRNVEQSFLDLFSQGKLNGTGEEFL